MNNFTVYDVDLINAPLFHIYFEGGSGLTVWGVRIKTPATARNTDGIDPDSAHQRHRERLLHPGR